MLPLSQNQETDNNDNNDHRNGNGEAEFRNLTIELPESSHVKHLLSIEISTSYQNEDKYKHISSSTSDDMKSKMKRKSDDRNSRKTEFFPSQNLCVEINVEQEPWKRENKFGDIKKPSTVSQFPSGTQPEIFPEENIRSQVIASTSSYNHGMKSYHITSPHSFTPLSTKESESHYEKPSGKQADSQTCSDTTAIKAGHQQYYERTSISVGSQESPCFQEGCTVNCSVEQIAEEYTKIGNRCETKEEKSSDLNDKAYIESQKDYINENRSKSTIIEPDILSVEPGTVSLEKHSDKCISYRSFFPRDRSTSYITHSTPVTDKSRMKSSSTSFNKSTSITAILPNEPSISFSTKSPSITDIMLGKSSTSLTNISTFITDSPTGDPSITNLDKCKRMVSSVPEEKSESFPYKSSIITDLFSKLLPVKSSLHKNLSESVSDKAKSVAEGVFDETSVLAQRDFTQRIAQIPTSQLLNSKQPLEHTYATRMSPCYLQTKKQPKCDFSPSSSHSTITDFKNGKNPLTGPILMHHQIGEFNDSLPTGSGTDADIRSHVSWSINEEPLLSSTKVTDTNKSENSIAGESESTALSKTSLCGTKFNDKFPNIVTCTSRSKLSNSPEKQDISKYTNFCTSNIEGFDDQNKSIDGKKEFLIYSESTFSERQQVTAHDTNAINNYDFNSNIKEMDPSNEIRFPSSQACSGGCKPRESTGLSDKPNIEEGLCSANDISEQQYYHCNQLRKPPRTSIIKGSSRNSEKCPKYKDKTYKSEDSYGNLNISTDTFVGVVSGESSGNEQKPQEEYETPTESPRLQKVLWAVTRINIFEDESRTYEIMKPSEESPMTMTETSECIFVVIPQKKYI
jgi:hypothetical protein